MRVVISNEITIEDPIPEVKEYCERELVIKNPDYEKKKRLGKWLGNTPEKLALYQEKDGNLILPSGVYQAVYNWLWDDPFLAEFEFDMAANKSVGYGAGIPLYDYQEEAVAAMLVKDFGILQAPAGCGKTQMGLAMIIQSGVKALWLTHTKDLLQQSYSRAAQYVSGDLLGTITGGKVNIGKGITFATVQTMVNLDLDRYKYEWDMIIIDECHRVAGSPSKVTQFSKVLSALAASSKYGLSATVHRADDMIKATYALLGPVLYAVPEEAVAGKIEQVRILRRDTGIPISWECLDTDGTLLYANLIQYLCENSYRNWLIAADLLQNKEHYNLILSDRLEHLKTIYSLLPLEMQEQSVFVHGKSKAKEREQALEDMRAGKKRFLFATYKLAKEGLDIPRLDRLYMATPQHDYAIIVQAVGRIARHFDGKAEPVVYDYVDDIGYCQNQYKKRCTSYRKIHCIL